MVPPTSIAVIDIGSNSLKLLVAACDAAGALQELNQQTRDVRISAGLGRERPRLGEEGMVRGLAAIQELLAVAAPFVPARTILVATSAVRGAENGADFCARVQAATGHSVRILTGDEEAGLIGRGLVCDPALTGFMDFCVFDLGGGSLECLNFRQRNISQAVSLPLGCVRLTERFVPDVNAPFPATARTAIAAHTRAALEHGGFRFGPPGGRVVFTGGSMTTVRAIFAARKNLPLLAYSAEIGVPEIRALLDTLAPLTLTERQSIPGLPPARADVFPAALTTILAVGEAGGLMVLHHSLHNLRWGVAAEALEDGPPASGGAR